MTVIAERYVAPASHRPHGTRAKYKTEQCRCVDCTAAANAYRLKRERAHSRPDVISIRHLLPTGSVVSHLAMLRDAGVGLDQIARRSGIDVSTVKRIASGKRKRVTRATKEALLAVMPSDAAPDALVPADDTHEHLLALYQAGMSEREVAQQIHGPDARQVKIGARFVTRRTAHLVGQLADEYLIDPETDPERDGDPLAVWRLFLADIGDQSWREHAECRRLDQPVDERLAVFFPERGDNPAAAKAVCAACPVQEPCLEYALANGMQGVWGALAGEDRRVMRREQRVEVGG